MALLRCSCAFSLAAKASSPAKWSGTEVTEGICHAHALQARAWPALVNVQRGHDQGGVSGESSEYSSSVRSMVGAPEEEDMGETVVVVFL